MPRMTPYEFANFQSRQVAAQRAQSIAATGCDDESELHAQIRAECARRGWKCWGGSMAHKTHRDEGEPDFHIWAECGRYFSVECKTRTGKLRPWQLQTVAWANKLQQPHHIVRSFEEFIQLTKNQKD